MKPNRRFFSIIAVAILTIAFSAFSKGGKPKAQFKGYAKMDGGTYFLLLKTGTGTTPVDTGGAVFVKIKFKTDKDSVFLDINAQTQAPSYPMRIDKPMYKGDFLDMMARLHVGDSASFFVVLDSLKKYYPREFDFKSFGAKIDTMKYLGFAVEVDSIYSRSKVDGLRAKAEEMQRKKQMESQRIMAIMKPISDSAKLKEPMLRENDFAMLSDYIKTKWTGPKNPDADGIFFQETRPGVGANLQSGMTVSVRYTGRYLDGTIFDSNMIVEGEDAMTFRLGVDQMIQGFTLGVSKMKMGSKAVFIVPPCLGYKDGLTRIFEVEVVKTNPQ